MIFFINKQMNNMCTPELYLDTKDLILLGIIFVVLYIIDKVKDGMTLSII